jgi:hypothetical protein
MLQQSMWAPRSTISILVLLGERPMIVDLKATACASDALSVKLG